MTLHHSDNKILTEWYTKNTWSGRYLNFHSQHHISQKKSVVIGLADRALILSDPPYRLNALQKIKEVLMKNSYPEKLINGIIKSRKKKTIRK